VLPGILSFIAVSLAIRSTGPAHMRYKFSLAIVGMLFPYRCKQT